MNPNDCLREQILQWFYQRNAHATSQYGKKGSAVKISDVKKGLKESYGLKQSEVISNLTYLIDKGWINKTEVAKTVTVKGGTVPSTVTWYEISSDGIDKIEGDSQFKEVPRYAGINISATGANVITVGEGNIVNAKFKDLYAELNSLESSIASSSLDESRKLDITVDIESIKDQLAKEAPDKTIIKRIWSRIQQIGNIVSCADAIARVAPFMTGLLSS